eukprot:748779-Hanusia_phi.AAC.1
MDLRASRGYRARGVGSEVPQVPPVGFFSCMSPTSFLSAGHGSLGPSDRPGPEAAGARPAPGEPMVPTELRVYGICEAQELGRIGEGREKRREKRREERRGEKKREEKRRGQESERFFGQENEIRVEERSVITCCCSFWKEQADASSTS